MAACLDRIRSRARAVRLGHATSHQLLSILLSYIQEVESATIQVSYGPIYSTYPQGHNLRVTPRFTKKRILQTLELATMGVLEGTFIVYEKLGVFSLASHYVALAKRARKHGHGCRCRNFPHSDNTAQILVLAPATST